MLVRLLLCVNIFILFCVTRGLAQNELNSGLYFASSEVIQDKRTSLNLTPEKPIKLSDGLKLEFDIQLRSGDGYYGYVFRIVSNSTDNFDLITNYASADDNFSLIFKDKILCSFRWEDIPDLNYDSWFHITFKLDLENQVVELDINDVVRTASINFEKENISFNILFGISKLVPFQSTDVSPMTLKNIEIYNQNDKLIRNWLLSKHIHNGTYDEIVGALAVTENPRWMIDAHLAWEEVMHFNLDAFYGVVSNDETDELYFVDENKITSYNLVSGIIDSIPYLEGNPYRQMNEKHIVYYPYTNEIWSYNLDETGISKFDMSKGTWSEKPVVLDEANFGHHNKLISPVDSSLVAMFGYGLYEYKSTVFNYNPKSDEWAKHNRSSQIEPRYLAASGLLNDETLLIFGGYGSKTGRQELSPGTYYDLYSLDLNSFEFKKLQNYALPEFPFVPGESLIVDDDSTGFYTLIFDNSKYESRIMLAKFGIYEPSQFVFPDSIVFNFLDTESWSYLYLNKSVQKLFAVTNNKSSVHIYSMAYPPLVQDDVFQVVHKKGKSGNKYFKLLFIGLACCSVVFGYLIFRKKQKKDSRVKRINPVFNKDMFRKIEPVKKSSVLFLGGFQIYNEAGVDITSGFSPILKQLFLLIFFHTVHRVKGISSKKLDETLWFDKSDKSARNNRNVNISKLRNAIEEVGGLEILSENSYWKLKMSSNIYCDYLRVLNIISKKENEEIDVNSIIELSGLLENGELLPNLQEDWIDFYKSQYTDKVIDFLVKIIFREELKDDNKSLMFIANSIFSLDSLNEDALMVKCQILQKKGKGSIAINTYKSFCKEYLSLLNTDYQISFNDILKGKSNN